MEVKWMAVLVDFFNKGYGLPLLGLAAACSVIFGLIILWNGEATEVATQTENSSAEGSGSRDSTGVEAPTPKNGPL